MLLPSNRKKPPRLPPSEVNRPTGGNEMGLVYAELLLISADDLALYHHGYIAEEQIKSIHVKALVDSGAYQRRRSVL